jgi:hypothetical protein
MKSDFIPRPDGKFHAWQNNLVGKIDPVAGALGITEAAMTELHTKKARWDAAYKKADDPATRTPFTLEFSGHERGKTVYFALRWENTRGEKGHWSPIQNAIVP